MQTNKKEISIINNKLRNLFSLLNWYEKQIIISFNFADKTIEHAERLDNLLRERQAVQNTINDYFYCTNEQLKESLRVNG